MNDQKRPENAPVAYKLCKLYHYEYNPRKKWLLVFTQYNVRTGLLHRRVFTGFNNIPDAKQRLKEARLWEIFINEQLVSGKVYDPDSTVDKPAAKPAELFEHDFQAMLTVKAASLSRDTVDAYRSFWNKWKEYLLSAGIKILLTKEVTPELCQGFEDYLLSLSLSNKTRNNYTGCLKSVCSYFMKPGRKRFTVSPAADLEPLPVESEPDEPFSDEQAERIIARIEEKQDYQLLLFIYFILYTFARPGKEVRLLKVKDLKEGTVLYGAKNSKTNASKTPTITKALGELIERLGIRDANPEHYVFTIDRKPGPVAAGWCYFYRRHRNLLRELEIKGKYTLYSWKYTGNIRLFAAGAHLKSIQRQNGHTTLRTTEKYLNRAGVYIDNEIFEKFI